MEWIPTPTSDLSIDRAGYDKVRTHLTMPCPRARLACWGMSFPRETMTPVLHQSGRLRSVGTEMMCAREETFGPLFPILEFENEEQAVRWGNQTEFGLAAYVFTGDSERGHRVASRLRFGHVGINTATGPTPEAPFGGMKQSGLGREGGPEGLMEFVEVQTIPEPLTRIRASFGSRVRRARAFPRGSAPR